VNGMSLCLHRVSVYTLQRTATHCKALQHTATHCNTLQRTATHCNALQHTATHCNTLLCLHSCERDVPLFTHDATEMCEPSVEMVMDVDREGSCRHLAAVSRRIFLQKISKEMSAKTYTNRKETYENGQRSLVWGGYD